MEGGCFVDECVVDRGAVYWRVVDGKSVVGWLLSRPLGNQSVANSLDGKRWSGWLLPEIIEKMK